MKLKKIFSITEYEDERVKALEYKSYSEAGFLLVVLAFIDLVVRGIFMDRPLSEWIVSLIFVVTYIIYVFIRQSFMKITKDHLLEKEEKRKNNIEEFSFLGTVFLYVLWKKIIQGTSLIPSGMYDWIISLVVFVVICAFMYSLSVIISKKIQKKD
ncbi:DUF6773 family protein [Priestia sp. HNGD-A6]|uniref:DUF6773 family protein n=1 Tax=Priestia sp. HNGD-A6 TaxID=3092666 RepID=UPI003892BC9B